MPVLFWLGVVDDLGQLGVALRANVDLDID